MSKMRIENSLRLTVYDAYKWRFFYMGNPVPYIDFEADHIIPESQETIIESLKN